MVEKRSEENKVWYAPNRFQAYGEEEIKAVNACLEAGWLAPGPLTAEFEAKVAALFAKKHGLMVNSGSSANLLLACVLELKGKKVVTPACTFATTVAPLLQVGAEPVFCDVVPGAYVPTVEAVMAVVTDETACCCIPNLVGNHFDWAGLRKALDDAGRKDIILWEDSADTIVHTEASDVSITSFYSSHVITAGGGGGMVMFNDEKLKMKALQYRDWGRVGNNSEDFSERFGHEVDGMEYDFKFLYSCVGYNLKSTEMNAAFGLVQLQKLDGFVKKRNALVKRYLENLKGTKFVLPDNSREPNWLAFPLMTKNRKSCLQWLEEHNVQTRVCFAGNITRHPAFRHLYAEFPAADQIMAEGFLVGAHHGLTEEDVDYVCDVLKAWEATQ